MKRGALIDKGAAAALTLLFLAVVRPDPMPSGVAWGITAIMMYEVLSRCIRRVRIERRREAIRRNMRAMKYDGQRWADEWIRWPLKEVS